MTTNDPEVLAELAAPGPRRPVAAAMKPGPGQFMPGFRQGNAQKSLGDPYSMFYILT